MRLLVIEDEPDIASALQKGLRQVGYAVDIALDGESGSELALVNDYDLLILDLNLPGVDGLEVCHRVRAECPSLLILMLTARSRPDERVTGLDLGADDYLVKPFHFAELTARVRALVHGCCGTCAHSHTEAQQELLPGTYSCASSAQC